MPDKIVKDRDIIYLTPKTRKILRRLILIGAWVAAIAYIYKLREDNEHLLEVANQLMDANQLMNDLVK